jgi:hypothetical protein
VVRSARCGRAGGCSNHPSVTFFFCAHSNLLIHPSQKRIVLVDLFDRIDDRIHAVVRTGGNIENPMNNSERTKSGVSNG